MKMLLQLGRLSVILQPCKKAIQKPSVYPLQCFFSTGFLRNGSETTTARTAIKTLEHQQASSLKDFYPFRRLGLENGLDPRRTGKCLQLLQRQFSTASTRSNSTTTISLQQGAAEYAAKNSAKQEESSQKDSIKVSKPIVAYWFFASACLVFGIVILGGVTRLTESGLSIVEWNLIKGMKPPTNDQEWQMEFEKYKNFPEFQLLNQNMTLDEFKRIFYMEWAHRMWGRAIGLFFILPFAYFATRGGYMTKKIRNRSLVIAGMIGTQGLFGWLMVKSGLDEEIVKRKDVPRVNHFWLSAHLGSAFLIYSAMLASGLEILKQNRVLGRITEAVKANRGFKALSIAVVCMVFTTAISGAWVAGLDAGLIYNEFPYMGEGLVPSDMWAFSTAQEEGAAPRMSWIENLARNPSAVQFNHRLLAISTFTAISTLWIISRRFPVSSATRLASSALMGTALIQVALGITTLVYFVPLPVAAAHQTGSISLLSVGIWLLHTLRRL